MLYDIQAELYFDEITQGFDRLVPKKAELWLKDNKGGLTALEWGKLEIVKIGSQKPVSKTEEIPDKEVIEHGLDGFLTFARGKVTVTTPEGKVLKARNNMNLIPGCTIRTDANSVCEIVLSNNEVIRMMQRSVYTLPVDVVKEKKTILEKGSALFSKIKDALTGDDFYVETPNTVFGIRGTEFYVQYDDNNRETLILVKEGLVSATDKTGNQALLQAGMKATAIQDKKLVVDNYSAEEAKLFDAYEIEKELAQKQSDRGFSPVIYVLILLAVVAVVLLVLLLGKKGEGGSNFG